MAVDLIGADIVPPCSTYAQAAAATSPGLGERQWLALVGIALLTIAGVPYVLSAAFGPHDLVREGTFWFMRDFSQYQAAMRDGAASASWLIHDRFTAEPHAPIFMYPLYVGLGKLSALLHLSDLLIFACVEWVGRIVLVVSLYAFAATFLSHVRERRLAFLLAVGTLGLAGWTVPLQLLLNAVGASGLAARLAPVNPYLEINSFGVFFSAPHLMLGLAFTLLSAPLYLRASRLGGRWLLAFAADVAALSLVHQFNLPVVVAVYGIDGLLRALHTWRTTTLTHALGPLLPGVVAGVVAAPLALYNFYLFDLDPFWSHTYGVQNLMPAPLPWALPVDFGLVLLAAPFAYHAVRAWPADRQRLLLLWVVLGLLCMYIPVPYQRRFGLGAQPGLACFAALGIWAIKGWLSHHGWGPLHQRVFNYGLICAAAMTSVLVYVALLGSAVSNHPVQVYLWTRAEADAGQWLGAHATAADVVLASVEFSNPLVGVMDGRVVFGHIVATRDSAAKQALVKRFFAADTTAQERSDLLRQSGATVVALGPDERALGVTSLADQPELTPIYDEEGVLLYRVAASP